MKIAKIPFDASTRMLRIGLGKHAGRWFLRVDLWSVGYRVTFS
jgi:hypothetical protein